ncbi:MAG: zf-HC2 domain-containing protein [Polyangiales bacterium]
MTSEHPSTEFLQRGYDGDLTNQEAAELHRHLAGCPACQRELDTLGRLGQMVRWATRDAADVTATLPDFDAMFAAIDRSVSGIAKTPATLAPEKPAHTATIHRPSRWLQRAAPALGAVALAAAALLMVVRQETVPGDVNTPATNESDVIAIASPSRSEVVDVDFGSNAGQVFDIPMSDGSPIPVVWIDDDDEDEE